MAHYQRLRDLREDADKTLERAVMLAKYYNVSLDYIAGISSSRHPLDLDNLSSPAEILSDKITQLSDNEKQAVKDTLSSVIDMIK